MLMEELEEELQQLMPHCRIRKDSKGQVVIYSGLVDDGEGELIPMEEDDDVELPEDEDLVPYEEEDDDD